jgi:hypothetical protein
LGGSHPEVLSGWLWRAAELQLRPAEVVVPGAQGLLDQLAVRGSTARAGGAGGVIALSLSTAGQIWQLIDEHFGPGYWDGFERYMTEPSSHDKEWRFEGTLGFGGKVHYNGRRLYVSAYPSDMALDPFMEQDILAMNEALEALLADA